jgi:diacylglycerol kinase (ATP)
MKIRVAFIINGTCKLHHTAKRAIDLAKKNVDLICQFAETKHAKHAIDLALLTTDQGFDAIVAVGGDGTCNEVINGILLAKRKKKVVFGVIPNGTGNDFYKMIGDFDPEIFVESLCKVNSKKIDIISVEINQKRWFSLNIAGIGFDGYVVNTLKSMRDSKNFKGKLAYSVAILCSFIRFRKLKTEISCDTFSYTGKTLMMIICNGKAFGHGLIISPDSKIDDGLLNVVLLGEVSFFDYIKNLSNLKKGKKVNHKNVHYFETKSISIKMVGKKLYTETDGEVLGQGDVKFEIVPSCIDLLV